MKFEDLKLIFSENYLITFKVNENASSLFAKYIRISKQNKEDQVYLSNAVHKGEFEINIPCKVESEKYNYMIDRLEGRDYIAKVLSVTENKIIVDVIVFPRYELFTEKFEIAVGDQSLDKNSYSALIDKLNEEYCFELGNKRLYVMARHQYARDKQFSLVNSNRLIDICEKKRSEIDLEDERREDTVYTLIGGEKQYDKNSYSYSIMEASIEFVNVSLVAKVAKRNAAFINSNLEKYVTLWRFFCEKEFEYVRKQQREAGRLKYSSYNQTEEGYEFEIEADQTQIEKFLKIITIINPAEKGFDNLTVEGQISLQNGKCINTNIGLRLKKRVKNRFYCEKKRDDEKEIPGSGTVQINIYGYEKQYERRNEAIEKILSSKSAKPDLAMLLSGELSNRMTRPAISAMSSDLSEKCFDGKMPTQSQLEAIRIALNTPDIAIIQGPPGTGKTKVINAIQHRLSQESGDKKLAFGKNLMTAYQRSATKNLASKLEIFGLPTPSILGEDRRETKLLDDTFESWLKKKTKEINEVNSGLVEDLNKKKARECFYNILMRFNVEQYTYENVASELKTLLQTVDEKYLMEKKENLEELLAIADGASNNTLSQSYESYIAKNIPTNEISFADDGKKLIQQICIRLENVESIREELSGLSDCFTKESIDFSQVKSIKNRILVKLKPHNNLLKPRAFNEKVYSLLQEIEQLIDKDDATNEQKILLEYMDAFNNNPVQIRSAIDKFLTVISATHQKTVDEAVIEKKEIAVYDNVLVDEAARSCPPDLLIPLSCAKDRIILVGDHKQLPQLINKEIYDSLDEEQISSSDKLSLQKTMFEHLMDQVQKLTEQDGIPRFITLNTQFRMRKILGDFVSRNFYEEDGVKIESVRDDKDFYHTLPGIENKAMVWMNVSSDIEEKVNSGGYVRKSEAYAIAQHVKKMLESPASKGQTFAVMSFYQKQIHAIKEKLDELGVGVYSDGLFTLDKKYQDDSIKAGEEKLKIDTVDAFQGLECDFAYLSITRTGRRNLRDEWKNKSIAKFGFLTSQNRLCVALSRQRKCLILVGDNRITRVEEAKENIGAICNFYQECKKGGVEVAIIQ